MSRFLFVVPPLAGHVNPAAGVARGLTERGHRVAWVAHREVVGSLLPPDAVVYPAGDRFLDRLARSLPERTTVRGPAALQFLWDETLCPLTLDMVAPVGAAVDDFHPDVIVADQQAHAGAIVAADRGLPWATSATTSAELVDPLALVPRVRAWIQDRLQRVLADLGRPELATAGFDPRFSPHLVLVFSTEALAGPVDHDPRALAWVGPVLDRAAHQPPLPWEWLSARPEESTVLVTVGTVNHDLGRRFLAAAVDAVADSPRAAVVVAPPAWFPRIPDNVLVQSTVPQLDLLARVDAVVCHAGHNTVCESLAFGLPLVVAPIRDDQPIVAEQVVRAGAGVRLRFGRARPADLARALDEVLGEPRYRQAAARVATSFAAAGGAAAAAERLEQLAAGDGPTRGGPPRGGAERSA